MGAKDLRLNNNILDSNGNIVRVNRLVEKKISVNDNPFAESEDLFSGIPLTEGWLLKFGFEQYHEGNNAYPTYHLENFIVDDKFQPIDVGFKIADYEIKYVHQLQNLFFALTGRELTNKE